MNPQRQIKSVAATLLGKGNVAATKSESPERRADSWLGQLIEIIGSDVRAESTPNLFSQVQLARRAFGEIQLVDIQSAPQTITRAASPQSQQVLVWIKLDGAGSVTQDGRTAHLALDTLCVCDSARPLSVRFASRSRDLLFVIPVRQLREIFSEWQEITALTINGNQGPAAVFINFAKSLSDFGSAVEKESLADIGDAALNLLIATLRSLPLCKSELPSHIEVYHKDRIREFVKNQLRDPNLSIESISQAVELSPRYVHRLFSNEKLPLMKWVWKERLEHCCRDLALPSLAKRSISEVAFFWGFNNLPHFSRTFRNRFGVSPREFRQKSLRATEVTATPGAGQNLTA